MRSECRRGAAPRRPSPASPVEPEDRKNNASVRYALGPSLKRSVLAAVEDAPKHLTLQHSMLHRGFDELHVAAQSEITRALRGLDDVCAPPNRRTPVRLEFEGELMHVVLACMSRYLERTRRRARALGRRARRPRIMAQFRGNTGHPPA